MNKTRLKNDCWYSGIQVFPKNWNTTRVYMRDNWYIWYRFYDPTFKDEKNKGLKLVIIKAGIDEYVEREQRQAAVRFLVDDEQKGLEELGYNPFTGQHMADLYPEPELIYRISPTLPWTQALEQVRLYMKVASCTQDDLKCTAAAIHKAAIRLRIEDVPISQIKRLHVKRALERAQADSKTKSDLLMLFEQLLDVLRRTHCASAPTTC